MMIAIGNFFFAYRNAIFPMLALCVFLPGARVLQDPMRSLWLGFAIAACGEAVRFATIGLKYIIRGGQGRRVFARDLVTQGVYAHCRNPMYVGNLLILAGVALASNSWSCVVISLPLFIFIDHFGGGTVSTAEVRPGVRCVRTRGAALHTAVEGSALYV